MPANSVANRSAQGLGASLAGLQFVGLGVQLGLVDAQVLGQLTQLGVVAARCVFDQAQLAAGHRAQQLFVEQLPHAFGLHEQAVARLDALLQAVHAHQALSF